MIRVTSEISPLHRLLIHSPGGEINNILPNKREEWLIDDILDTQLIQEEYAEFAKLLLLFLDPQKLLDKSSINPNIDTFHKSEAVIEIQYKLAELFSDPYNDSKSLCLIEQVAALEKIHFKRKVDLIMLFRAAKEELDTQQYLGDSKFMSLAKTLISGKLEWRWSNSATRLIPLDLDKHLYIFRPIPNLMFTRDIGVCLNNHFLITKTANGIRHREVLLMKYLAECFLFKSDGQPEYKEILDKVIEISEDDDYFQYNSKELEQMKVTFEGGDIMMVSPRHLLIGKSERTSDYAINKLIHRIFKKSIGIEIISVIQIAEKRSQMHIDTIMTHVAKDVWILYGRLSSDTPDEAVAIRQFYCKNGMYASSGPMERDFFIYSELESETIPQGKASKHTYENLPMGMKYSKPQNLESLLADISRVEYGVTDEVHFVYSGGNRYPYDEREQWTDACNSLCLGNGIIIGYDRNRRTAEAFNQVMSARNGTNIPLSNKQLFDYVQQKRGKAKMYTVTAEDLLQFVFEAFTDRATLNAFCAGLRDMMITIKSGELSRARGGSHCMSLPLLRD